FIFVFKPEWFGITDPSIPARLSFFLVGVWWLGFAQIPFRHLPESQVPLKNKGLSFFLKVKKEFKQVFLQIKKIQAIKRFLPAYFFYAMGIQTLVIVASAF